MYQVMNYHTEDQGRKTVLVNESGISRIHVLMFDSPIRAMYLPKKELRYMRPATKKNGKEYSAKTVARRWLRAATRVGCYKSARKTMRAILESQQGENK